MSSARIVVGSRVMSSIGGGSLLICPYYKHFHGAAQRCWPRALKRRDLTSSSGAAAIGRRHGGEEPIDDAVKCLPRRFAVALVAHDDRIPGIEFFVQHVSAGELGADQVPDQLIELVARHGGHAGGAPPALEAILELPIGE